MRAGSAKVLLDLLRHQGISWAAFRARYAIRKRLGSLERRAPAKPWDAWSVDDLAEGPGLVATWLDGRLRGGGPRFLIDPADRDEVRSVAPAWDEAGDPVVENAERIVRGRLRYFGNEWLDVGSPPDWHRNPVTGQTAPADRHWSRIDDFGHGDIKLIWEANRFGFVFDLVRAYRRTGNQELARLFWTWVEDWAHRNPPNLGPAWMCGQETALRVLAWCFGMFGFGDAPSTDPPRLARITKMIAVSGSRIEANLDYAISQRNNHGVSEGAALWTIGILFPQLHDAGRWRRLGRDALEREARQLIADDGSFSQHSVNYHRVMLQAYLWSVRLGQRNGCELSAETLDRIRAASRWLWRLHDDTGGGVPRFGADDGALILPLTGCGFHDFRPVLQAAHVLLHGSRTFEPGPWDEEPYWLVGRDALRAPVDPEPLESGSGTDGGWHVLRSAEGLAAMHAPATFRTRPSHADLLHVDVWWRGWNVALDPGTNSYNAPPPWDDPFARTRFHNTVSVDGLDQMERAARFLWLPWARGRTGTIRTDEATGAEIWEGSHFGYRRLADPVSHRRAVVRLRGEHWLVVDRLRAAGRHDYRLHWLHPDVPFHWDAEKCRLALDLPVGRYHVRLGGSSPGGVLDVARAVQDDPRAVRWHLPFPRRWRSPPAGRCGSGRCWGLTSRRPPSTAAR